MTDPDKTELHNKFIEKVSQDVIFYKQPFLPSEVKYIFDCIDKAKGNIDTFNKSPFSYTDEKGTDYYDTFVEFLQYHSSLKQKLEQIKKRIEPLDDGISLIIKVILEEK